MDFGDVLSIFTVVLCFIQKFPQIIRIWRTKSAVGINTLGLYIDLFSCTITALYNFLNDYQLLYYLEYPMIIVQQIIFICLVSKYKHNIGWIIVLLASTYTFLVFGFITRMFDQSTLNFAIPLCLPFSLSNKIMQLYEMYKVMNADNVSLTTWFLSALTNYLRVYTVLTKSKDQLLLINFVMSGTLSSMIALMAIFIKQSQKDARVRKQK